ncbi:cyclin-like protein [Tothia fuscella]|uniref:Transcription initiation factor IIB n=1 Tax=Tothia fuscella TaxID=1048955 RepID=A0A9P4NI73_9PEZI|nr:cyclin-like protein [Tothia fuscella]
MLLGICRQWAENLNIVLTCPECREFPPNLVEEFSSGDTVCGSCGMVLASHLVDTRSEWRTFSNDDQGNDDPSRVGEAANPLLNGSQLSSTIAFSMNDPNSRDLSRAQNKSTADKTAKGLTAAYRQIDHFCNAWHFSGSIAEGAKGLYKMTDDAKSFKGKGQEAILAGCIFIACRQGGNPRTFKEITALTKVPKKEIGRTFKLLENFFKSHTKDNSTSVAGGVVMKNDTYIGKPSTNANELCGRFCSNLGLPPNISLISGECAELLVGMGWLAGRSPLSVAAVAIYVVSHLMGKPRSAKEISVPAGVSDGTIRTAYKQIHPHREQLIKEDWLQKGGNLDLLPQA